MQNLLRGLLVAIFLLSVGCGSSNPKAEIPTGAQRYDGKEPDSIKKAAKEGDPRSVGRER